MISFVVILQVCIVFTIGPCSVKGDTEKTYIIPLFMSQDKEFSSSLSVIVRPVKNEYIACDITCRPSSTAFCKDRDGTNFTIEQVQVGTRKSPQHEINIRDLKGPSVSGKSKDIMILECNATVVLRVESVFSTYGCGTIYSTGGIGDTASTITVPLLTKNSFAMIHSGDKKTHVTMTLKASNPMSHTVSTVRRTVTSVVENPFKDGCNTSTVNLDPNEVYLFVLRDFPELISRGVTGITFKADGAIAALAGTSDREGELACKRGHSIESVKYRPYSHQQRYFMFIPYNILIKNTDLSVMSKMSVTATINRIDFTVSFEFHQKITNQTHTLNGAGSTIIMDIPADVRLVRVQARSRVLVQLSTTITNSQCEARVKAGGAGRCVSDQGLVQIASQDVFLNEFIITDDKEHEDLDMLILVQADVEADINTMIQLKDKVLALVLKEGWVSSTCRPDVVYKKTLLAYHRFCLRILSIDSIKGQNNGKMNPDYDDPKVYLKITSEFPFIVYFLKYSETRLTTWVSRGHALLAFGACSESIPRLGDGIDNDCDGMIDEDKHFNNIDEDGDGEIDEDIGETDLFLVDKNCTKWDITCSAKCRSTGLTTARRECPRVPSELLGTKHGLYYDDEWCNHLDKACNTECPVGRWGQHCQWKCPKNCWIHGDCYKYTGACKRCPAGFGGRTCSQLCPSGMFGAGCFKNCCTFCEDCLCDRVYGNCDGDEASGWVYVAITTGLLLVISSCILLHALFLFSRNSTRMWLFRDPSFAKKDTSLISSALEDVKSRSTYSPNFSTLLKE